MNTRKIARAGFIAGSLGILGLQLTRVPEIAQMRASGWALVVVVLFALWTGLTALENLTGWIAARYERHGLRLRRRWPHAGARVFIADGTWPGSVRQIVGVWARVRPDGLAKDIWVESTQLRPESAGPAENPAETALERAS